MQTFSKTSNKAMGKQGESKSEVFFVEKLACFVNDQKQLSSMESPTWKTS